MSREPRDRNKHAAGWIALVLVTAIAAVLVVGIFVIPQDDEPEGIDMREDVDAVVDEVPGA